MNTHADPKQANKSEAAANDIAQKQPGNESAFAFEDHRPEIIAQRRLHEMANNGPQAKQAARFQAMADNHSAKQFPIQKKEGAKHLHPAVSRLDVGVKDNIYQRKEYILRDETTDKKMESIAKLLNKAVLATMETMEVDGEVSSGTSWAMWAFGKQGDMGTGRALLALLGKDS